MDDAFDGLDDSRPPHMPGGRAPSDPAHVLYAWPYVEWGGAQRYLFVIMRRLAATVRLTIVMPEGSAPALAEELTALGATIRPLHSRLLVTAPHSLAGRVRMHVRAWWVQAHFWRTCRAAAGANAVIHCDVYPPQFTLPLALLARRFATIVTLHTALPRVGRMRRAIWQARFALLNGQPGFRMIAANDSVRQSLKPYMRAAAVEAIPLAYSPVEFDEIERARAGRDNGTPVATTWRREPGRFLVITGAQFIDRKGCRVLADAARIVHRAAPDVEFLWMGPLGLTSDSASVARDAGIRYLAQGDLCDGRQSYLRAVASADVFVLPSLEDGLPLALLEAMALGVAVITTPVNAIPEAVTDERSGLLVPPGDARRLADAILRLRSDGTLRTRLAGEGRERSRAFDAERTAATTLEVYAAAASAMAGTPARH
jgi:glycosyltransferase involved in cell wall biosynthesis